MPLSPAESSHHLPTRQIRMHLPLRFMLPPDPDMTLLDRWLTDVLEIPAPSFDNTVDTANTATQWLKRCLLVCRELMQGGQLPVFETPAVISCRQSSVDSVQWDAIVSLPRLDNIPPAAYNLALQSSLRFGLWAGRHPINDDNLTKLFTTMRKEVITPLCNLAPTGKSTLPILKVANQLGIPFIHLGSSIYQLGWGHKARRIDRSTTGEDSAMGSKLAQDKVVTANLLRQAGLPAPVHRVVSTLDEARTVSEKIGWPVVIKPADRDRGEGVTVDVTSDTLKHAFESASALSKTKKIIVERQVAGCCHRLVIAGGKLLYALKRQAPSIVGDGQKSIGQLLETARLEQRRRALWKRATVNPVDDEVRAVLAAAGYDENSVPEAGQRIFLRKIESTQWGGTFEEVSEETHPDNIRIAVDAAQLFGLHTCGIDIITDDISRPWHESDAIINEVNYAPLLGGTEQSRNYLPTLLKQLIVGDGRIPVEVYVGGQDARAAATTRWETLYEDDISACLSNDLETFSHTAEPWPMPFSSLFQRVRAMILSPRVEVLIMVVQTTEFQVTGLPLEQVNTVHWFDDNVFVYHPETGRTQQSAPPEQISNLKNQLRTWTEDFREN